MYGHLQMQEKGVKKMPDIKLPYTEEGMDLVDQIQDKVDAVGGDISSEYPTLNATDRMMNTPMDTGIGSMYKHGGKVPKYQEGGKVKDKDKKK